MRELDKISDALFNKIRARFDSVSIGDDETRRITDPEKARFFNFDYVSEDGENFGNVTISLIDENALKIYFSANITDDLDESQEDEWYDFLRNLKKFARRNMLTFDARDIARSNLNLKDLKQQANSDSTYTKDEIAIVESRSRLYGVGNNKHVSFGDVGTHKLIIKHKNQIDPERHGSRGRHIEHIFVETPMGERFLLNHTNLHGARATANHLRHGGNIGDEGSDLINDMVKEMASMKHFVRSMRNRTFEDAETTGMVEAAMHRYSEVKDHLKRFHGRNGHELLIDMCSGGQSEPEDEIDVDGLRERFVKKIYDDRFTDALPYVYRAYKQRKLMDTDSSKEFESWANDITEATWEYNDASAILKLVEKPIKLGVDGLDAIGAVVGIHTLDNDQVKRSFRAAAESLGIDADARRIIAGWLASQDESELANQIIQLMKQQNVSTEPQPASPPVPKQNYGASTADTPVTNEAMVEMRRLAGLRNQ